MESPERSRTDMMDDHNNDPDAHRDDRMVQALVALVLTAVAIGGAIDLYLDAPDTWLSAHVLVELTLMSVSAGLAIYLWRQWRVAAAGLERSRAAVQASAAERDAWRARAESALDGLGSAIDEQFERWALTPTEREVAFALLRGAGHKQIAGATGRSERTVRQHAVAVYQKSGLGGRAELAAFFLEGLMRPRA